MYTPTTVWHCSRSKQRSSSAGSRCDAICDTGGPAAVMAGQRTRKAVSQVDDLRRPSCMPEASTVQNSNHRAPRCNAHTILALLSHSNFSASPQKRGISDPEDQSSLHHIPHHSHHSHPSAVLSSHLPGPSRFPEAWPLLPRLHPLSRPESNLPPLSLALPTLELPQTYPSPTPPTPRSFSRVASCLLHPPISIFPSVLRRRTEEVIFPHPFLQSPSLALGGLLSI